jgi:hypothetical protein
MKNTIGTPALVVSLSIFSSVAFAQDSGEADDVLNSEESFDVSIALEQACIETPGCELETLGGAPGRQCIACLYALEDEPIIDCGCQSGLRPDVSLLGLVPALLILRRRRASMRNAAVRA